MLSAKATPADLSDTRSGPLPHRSIRRDLALILLLAIPLLFVGLNAWGFLDPDEGRYAEIPREMLETGDFVTPTLNYVKYFEKPPLLYWLTAASFKVFGLHEWAARLVPALAAFGGLLMTYALGRRMFGARAGLLGAVVLVTTAIWIALGRMLLIDMLLSVLIYAALGFWWLGHTEPKPKQARWYFYAFWVAMGLAVMSKGPVAVVLVGGSIFIYLVLFNQWAALRGMQWVVGTILFLLITVPWFTLVAIRNPEFNEFFWMGQNVNRFLGKGENREHVKSVYWFLELWVPVTLPWALFIPGAVGMAWQHWAARSKAEAGRRPSATLRERGAVFALISGVCIVLFFSASTSKLIPYILPAVPFQALLIGAFLDRVWSDRAQWRRWPLLSGVALLAVILIIAAILGVKEGPRVLWEREGLPGTYIVAVCALGLVWAAGLLVALWKRHAPAIVATIVLGATPFFSLLLVQVAAIAPHRSLKPLLTYIQPGLERGGELLIYETYTQSVNFYPRRRVVLVRDFTYDKIRKQWVEGDAGEITRPGMNGLSVEERMKWFPHGRDALLKYMMQSGPVYAVVSDHEKAQTLVQEFRGKVVEIIANNRRAVIGNAAAAHVTPPKPDAFPVPAPAG